jgi:hypothetical protein
MIAQAGVHLNVRSMKSQQILLSLPRDRKSTVTVEHRASTLTIRHHTGDS